MTSKPSKKGRFPWIFFDLDDTIWNFTANSRVALNTLYDISPILRKLFKTVEEFIDIYHSYNSYLWLLYGRGEITTSQLKIERWRRTLATRQFEVLTAVCEELETTYLDILAACEERVEDVDEILSYIAEKAMIGVLSNGFSSTQYKKIRNSGLDRYINRMVVSEELGINKPDKRLFDFAEQATGGLRPFLMVGDNPETDILGAMKAGWYAVWINPSQKDLPFSDDFLKKEDINSSLFLGNVATLKEALAPIDNFINFWAETPY